jgi:hypothetical protein
VTVTHALANADLWEVELAPWALTIMRGGGTVIVPQEPKGTHADNLLPVRPMVLWAYTDLTDPRFSIGLGNRQGWAAYAHGREVFLKRFAHQAGARYPDHGSNVEVFTAGAFIELETLGPLARLAPGEVAEHVERWELHGNVTPGDTEDGIAAALTPLVNAAVKP